MKDFKIGWLYQLAICSVRPRNVENPFLNRVQLCLHCLVLPTVGNVGRLAGVDDLVEDAVHPLRGVAPFLRFLHQVL